MNTINTTIVSNLIGTEAKPKKVRTVTNKGKGFTSYLNENREGISKLRQRGFSWNQVLEVINNNGVPIKYGNLYQWKKSAFRK